MKQRHTFLDGVKLSLFYIMNLWLSAGLALILVISGVNDIIAIAVAIVTIILIYNLDKTLHFEHSFWFRRWWRFPHDKEYKQSKLTIQEIVGIFGGLALCVPAILLFVVLNADDPDRNIRIHDLAIPAIIILTITLLDKIFVKTPNKKRAR